MEEKTMMDKQAEASNEFFGNIALGIVVSVAALGMFVFLVAKSYNLI